MVILVRSKYEHFNPPWTFCTNPAIEKFFSMTCGREVGDFAQQLESYVLAGAPGAANTFEDQLNKLRSETIALIHALLGA